MLHDPISDLLTRIRNAQKQHHRHTDIPHSKQKENIAKVLEESGFIKGYIVNKEKRLMRVLLKYSSGRKPVIQGLRRISKPSVRRYTGHQSIPKVLGGMGIAILSTNRGVLEGEAARNEKLGGELLCYIW